MKKLKGTLVGTDGNAFALMGKFQRDAKKAKWPKDEIDQVLEDAKSSDYDHLVYVLANQYTN